MLYVATASMRFHSKPVVECALRSSPRLASRAKALAQELRTLEPKDIKKQLHVNDALAKEYATYLGNFEGQTPVACCALYDNPFYNAMGVTGWDEQDAQFANSHFRIFSGLYGLLRPFDQIQPLSLPVSLSTKLTNSKGKFLRDYWREFVQRDLYDDLQKLPMPVIIDLASQEDSSTILDVDALPEYTRIAKVEFALRDKEEAAEARGEFLRWALEERCMTVEELLDFRGLNLEGEDAHYKVNPTKSGEDHIVFEENKKGDAWRQKFSDFSGSKNQFLKEAASGKQRYLRSEVKKSLNKDAKQQRKKSVVY
mmetsp:Transcript_26054/g.56538  ORF Transcript_26054/g.56538 Transcript_26054/m.56538 type:complete len:311 (-) Transcript_26054:248-1180(-)